MTGTSDPGTVRVPDRDADGEAGVEGVTYETLRRQEVLGVGSNATVYAVEAGDGTPLALKEPHVEPPVPTGLAERFEREASAWEQVDDHPNVVTVYDAGTEPHPWLALERVGGGSLRDSDPGAAEALWTGVRLADALAHAHDAGIVHHDVTPGNVLLRETAGDSWLEPALSDWGVAALLEDRAANLEGLSPRYAAPEQFDPERFGDPGPATDLYQLGVVVYELLTGVVPFDGPPAAVRKGVLGEPPDPPTGVDPGLPAAVDGVLDRALAKDPGKRYDSAGGFAAGLAEVLREQTGYEPEFPELEGTDGVTGVATRRTSAPYDRAVALESEGFVRLTEAYFARREPAPPLEAWRRGLDLVDIREGRAVARDAPEDREPGPLAAGRSDGDAREMAPSLVEALRSGIDCAVLGPPGSGKSTICKRVACEWYDAEHGPVFYRESGAGAAFDEPSTLVRTLARTDGQALVVVEDAVQPEGQGVFELLNRVAETEDVAILVDARESEWREAGTGLGAFGTDQIQEGRELLSTVYVPRPDREEFDRFVETVEATVDGTLDVDLDRIGEEIRRASAGDEGGTQPGELFYLIHQLTALASDPVAQNVPSTLTELVNTIRKDLAAAGETALDVGMAVNLLNAAPLGVHPELLYAVAPDDPVAVDDAVDLLDGRVLFTRETDWNEGSTSYRSVHEAWSTEYLSRCLDTADEKRARERFGRVVTRILALADDPDRREQTRELLHERTPLLDRIEADPTAWADETVEGVFSAGLTDSDLAPLFGETTDPPFELPDMCSTQLSLHQAFWRGKINLKHGTLDLAENEFKRLGELAETVEITEESVPGFVGSDAEFDSIQELVDDEVAIDTIQRKWAKCVSEHSLSRIAHDRGDHEAAREHIERSLAMDRKIGYRYGEGKDLVLLGLVALRQGDLDAAEEHLEAALDILKEIGDTKGEAQALGNLGNVASGRGDLETAANYYEMTLDRVEELGDRHEQARAVGNLGIVADKRGHLEAAADYYERSLYLFRKVGDKRSQSMTLSNLGTVYYKRGELGEAMELLKEAVGLDREVGNRRSEAVTINDLGRVARKRGQSETAAQYHERSVKMHKETGYKSGQAQAVLDLGVVERKRDDLDSAADYIEAGLEHFRDLGDRRGEARALDELGAVAEARGDLATATQHYKEALELFREVGDKYGAAKATLHLGRMARERGNHERARSLLSDAAEGCIETNAGVASEALRAIVDTCERQGDRKAANDWCQRAIEFATENDLPEVRDRFEARCSELSGG